MSQEHKLYTELAEWWPLVSAPADYAEEADFFRGLLTEACEAPVETLLEFGCGGGNLASHLKRHFRLTLTDLSPDMLAVSKALNPECEHCAADMRTARLDRQFDAVMIHDAINYMQTEEDLRQTIETACAHVRPGGAAVFAPDCIRESFRAKTSHGGHDGPDGRAMRYLEWTWDPDPVDTTYQVDFAFLLRDAAGGVRATSDRHVCGIFPQRIWQRLLTAAGFRPHSKPSPWRHEVFVGCRPGP